MQLPITLLALAFVFASHTLATPLVAPNTDQRIVLSNTTLQAPPQRPNISQTTEVASVPDPVNNEILPYAVSTRVDLAVPHVGTSETWGDVHSSESAPKNFSYPSTDQPVITGMRMDAGTVIASLVERLSAVVEAAGSSFANQVKMLQVTASRIFRKRNKLMSATSAKLKSPGQLVVFLPAPPVAPHAVVHLKSSIVRIQRAELKNGILNVVLCESKDPARTTNHSIHVGDHRVDVQGIRVRRVGLDKYELKIRALLDQSVSIHEPDTTIAGMSREQLAEVRSFHPQVEDDTAFIQTQINCTAGNKGSGLNASLCTCDTYYAGDLNGQVLCVARIVDRVVNYEKRIQQDELAQSTFDKAIQCRTFGASTPGQDPRIAQKTCLTAVLQTAVDESPEVAGRQARQLLSATDKESYDGSSSLHVEARAAQTSNSSVRASDRARVPPSASKWSRFQIRLVAVVVYLLAVTALGLGLADIAKHYRRHMHASRRRSEFAQLPDHTRVLYTRIFW